MRRAFTVVELLVAVVVLLAVIIATSKIFNTASKVSSTGEANADVLQQGTIIEEQLRRDLARISRDGFMAIQCVVVRNDVNEVISPGKGAPLLNPQLDKYAMLRCDQLVFFTAGTEVSARWAGPGDLVNIAGGQQARAGRIFYGHGVQFPQLLNDPANSVPGSDPTSVVRPIVTGVVGASGVPLQVTPWTWFDPIATQLGWKYASTTQAAGTRMTANQPEARQWVLARKAVLLADDGGRPIYYPEPGSTALDLTIAGRQGPTSTTSIFGDVSYTNLVSPWPVDIAYYQELRDRNRIPLSLYLIPSPGIQNGWVDIAASDLDNVRRVIAPTLRYVDPAVPTRVTSIASPFSTFPGGYGTLPPPISWPSGTGAPQWPAGTSIDIVGNNMDAGQVWRYSTQRDRIMRGTFGMPAIERISTGTSGNFGLLGWPRSEKAVTNTDRKSEMLVSPTLVTNCSSFQVDWTWEPLTGRQTDAFGAIVDVGHDPAHPVPQYSPPQLMSHLKIDGNTVSTGLDSPLRGFEPFADSWPANSAPRRVPRAQPWFGFPDGYSDSLITPGDRPQFTIPTEQRLGVTLAQDGAVMTAVQRQSPVPGRLDTTNFHMRSVARQVEGVPVAVDDTTAPGVVRAPFGVSIPIRTYTAVFGFNQDEAYTVTPDGFKVAREDYTPWPTQIRVTCTIHDPRLVLDRGREFQFVLDVPKRRKD